VPSEENVSRFLPTPRARLAVTSHAPTNVGLGAATRVAEPADVLDSRVAHDDKTTTLAIATSLWISIQSLPSVREAWFVELCSHHQRDTTTVSGNATVCGAHSSPGADNGRGRSDRVRPSPDGRRRRPISSIKLPLGIERFPPSSSINASLGGHDLRRSSKRDGELARARDCSARRTNAPPSARHPRIRSKDPLGSAQPRLLTVDPGGRRPACLASCPVGGLELLSVIRCRRSRDCPAPDQPRALHWRRDAWTNSMWWIPSGTPADHRTTPARQRSGSFYRQW
jgi:hypothetical protein